MSRVDRRAQQVAPLEDPLPQRCEGGVVAVEHLLEATARAQRIGQALRGATTLCGRAAFDGGDERARRRAAVQLVDEQLLARIRRGGQKGREVGAEACVRDDRRAGGQQQQPHAQRNEATTLRLRHQGVPTRGFSAGSMLITERSPSASATSTLRTSLR